MTKKYFIITVDTEGDNLWGYKKGDVINTENAKSIPRFQNLCELYAFKPVYLTNYEMLCDDDYIGYIRAKEQDGLCEVGLHLHAWNTPPLYSLKATYSGNSYLIEYPDEIMREKFNTLYNLFLDKLGHKPFSHRAGRWIMDERYFKLLEEFNVPVDCSVTPHLNWNHTYGETMVGVDYSTAKEGCHMVGGVLEIPMTIIPNRCPMSNSILRNIKTVLKGNVLQLRPAICSLKEMKYIVDKCRNNLQVDYIMFMLHSSELMVGGSPYFRTIRSIEDEFSVINEIFAYAKSMGYVGVTLKEYYDAR